MKQVHGYAIALAGFLAAVVAQAKDYDIRDFGAKGDGVTKNTEAIQKAIDACSAAGGGRVVLEGGRYVSGTLLLKDGVDLHLDVTGVLVGSPDWRDWRDQPNCKHLNMVMCTRHRNAALIFADEAKRIAISGRGRIDANGTAFVESVPDYKEGLRFRRIYGLDKSPPRAVLFAGCTDVTVTDVTVNNLPAGWAFWVHDCDRVRFDRVSILTPVDYPNNDGIHVNCSRDVTISNCIIETGDDCVVVRANSASLRENRPCERVCVVNCTLRTYANGIRIAWLNDGVVRNCVFSNLVINRSANGIGIVLPEWYPRDQMPDQGREATLVENLSFDNIVMDRLNARPVAIEIATNAETRCAAIRNIRFSHMTCRGLEFPRLVGREGNAIEDVTFVDCTFTKVPDTTPGYENWRQDGFSKGLRKPGASEREHLKNVTFERCTFKDDSFKSVQSRPVPSAALIERLRADGAEISVKGCAEVRIADDAVMVTSTGAVSFVRIKWPHEMPQEALVLNDAWERSYGDLEWKSLAETRVSPWYYLASVSNRTWGVGVETGPGAMCCWEVTTNGATLVLDLRAGGQPVRLGGRTLKACRIVQAESREGESAWGFGRRFCKMMCPKPRLPKAPVYGYNDWYCAYGKNTATNFLADAAYIMECSKGCANPPYVVMDDGWQRNSPPVVHESGRGPWDAAGSNFGMDMPTFCGRIAALGAKPGLWYRPLRAWDELPDEQRLLANRDYLDPTVPAVKARIIEDIRRFRGWGFKLVKIDFLSYDLAQLWPCDPHPHYDRYIQDDRAWRDSSRTTAEVMRDLYQAMKDAAGDDVVIIGCNAFNHLAAGVFELQRTGNDTSGKKWGWTRDHGVNTLAMRSIQDGAFFKIDADCVGLAEEDAVPWELNRQWMDLLGRSGTPFFVSWRRQFAGPEVRKALAEAFRRAASGRLTIKPVDWQVTRTPNQWRDVDGAVSYDWGI